MKICVYAIAKDEAHFVPRFCDSARDADMILIADTGSSDGSQDVARQHGAVVHDVSISPWRFDLARNAALALVPADVDVCVSIDIDEVLQPGWREEIERLWRLGQTTRLRYLYDWGNGLKFHYDKIHARHGYYWKHPCHEYLFPDPRTEESAAISPMLMVVHKPDPDKSRSSYMGLLSAAVKEDLNCHRNAFYHARELWFTGQKQAAILEFERYLSLPGAVWDHERSYAYRVIGQCRAALGQTREAEAAFVQAASVLPDIREPWCQLALFMYGQARWEECFAFAMRAIRIASDVRFHTSDPVAWNEQPHDLASIAAWHLGLRDIAIDQVQIAISKNPCDKRLHSNLLFMRGDSEAEVS